MRTIIGHTIPNATPDNVTPNANASSVVETAKIKCEAALTKEAKTKNAGRGTPPAVPPPPEEKQPKYQGRCHFSASSDAMPVHTLDAP
mmetsp:Transcript_5681/g.12904  ORF Transcript_5681/g.12904 Transcript_5681/m.12904 type:complete len:88 (+) Transcript_5681:828-1091(+)